MDRLFAVCPSGQMSGAEISLYRILSVAQERGIRVVVCTPNGPAASSIPAGSRHVEIPELGLGQGPRPVAGVGMLRRARMAGRVLAEEIRPGDKIVANSILALPAVKAAGPERSQVSWLVHDVLRRPDWFALLKYVRPAIGRTVACSHAAAQPLLERGMQVRVAYHGVAYQTPRDDEPSNPVVGCAGLLTPWKGHELLLTAFAQLRTPNVRLELAGGQFPKDAGYAAHLQALCDDLGIASRVTFLGRVDAVARMRTWTVGVSASVEPEAQPLVVLEAMSVGLPMVGTSIGGTVELLGRGVGLLVPPFAPALMAGAIDELLADRQLRESLAARGLTAVRRDHRPEVQLPAMLEALVGAT